MTVVLGCCDEIPGICILRGVQNRMDELHPYPLPTVTNSLTLSKSLAYETTLNTITYSLQVSLINRFHSFYQQNCSCVNESTSGPIVRLITCIRPRICSMWNHSSHFQCQTTGFGLEKLVPEQHQFFAGPGPRTN